MPERRKQVTRDPGFHVHDVVDEALAVQDRLREANDRREFLEHRITAVDPWGDLVFPPLSDLAGYRLWFYLLPLSKLGALDEVDLPWQIVRKDHRVAYVVLIAAEEPPAAWREALYAELVDAVHLRLRSDVPVGCFLSGGLDSTLVTALARRERRELRTFSVSFPECAVVDEGRHEWQDDQPRLRPVRERREQHQMREHEQQHSHREQVEVRDLEQALVRARRSERLLVTEVVRRDRFGRERVSAERESDGPFGLDFEIESYLEHQSNKFTGQFDPNCYLYLSRASDLFDVADHGASVTAGLAKVRARRVLVVGVTTDFLFPVYQQQELAELLRETGHDVEYVELDCIQGHDSFLVNMDSFRPVIADFFAPSADASATAADTAPLRSGPRALARPSSIVSTTTSSSRSIVSLSVMGPNDRRARAGLSSTARAERCHTDRSPFRP